MQNTKPPILYFNNQLPSLPIRKEYKTIQDKINALNYANNNVHYTIFAGENSENEVL